MIPLVLLLAGLTASVPSNPMAQAAPRFIGAGVLRRHDSATHKVPIDVPGDCMFMLNASGAELSIEARSPSGRVYTSRDSTQGGHTDMLREFLGGSLGFLQVEKPELGTWTVTIEAGEFPDSVSHEAYQLQLMQEASTAGPQLTLLLPDSTRHRGDPVIVRASLLEDGKPVPGARVRAAVGTYEGGGSEPISLLDDGRSPDEKAGDGIYTGKVARLYGSGFAGAEVTASRRGVSGLPDFDREARTQFLIAASRSRLTGKIRDFPRDADGDGLNEEIVFAVGVEVTDAASLRLMGRVRDARGTEVWSFGRDARLEPGTRELELLCDTEELAKKNVPGPLALDSLTLFESETYATLDQATPAYRTRAYTQSELMHDAMRLVGSATARAVDLDRDGRFDALDVEAPIDIRYPGPYYSSAILKCGGEWIADADVRQEFIQGRNTIKLRFPGECIGARGMNGKWTVDVSYVGHYHEANDNRPSPKYGYNGGEMALDSVPRAERFESKAGRNSRCR